MSIKYVTQTAFGDPPPPVLLALRILETAPKMTKNHQKNDKLTENLKIRFSIEIKKLGKCTFLCNFQYLIVFGHLN